MLRSVIRGVSLCAALCASISVAGAGGCGGSTIAGAPGDGGASTGPGTHAADAGPTSPGQAGGTPTAGGPARNPPVVSNKVDLLFDVDNSASMGDKQAYLAQAVPDLVRRLVSPNCLDAAGNATGETAGPTGQCATGTAEFPPVQDMHIAIVSSSLGPRLGDACPATGPSSTRPLANGGSIDRHNDDQAHLLDRGSDPSNLTNYTETPVSDTGTAHFLDWFPSSNPAAAPAAGAPPIGDASKIVSDFQSMVVGTHAFGCGIESQLESWYRFLIQPDPYASLATSGGKAEWQGVDTVLLAQRAAFLRPDSLVAVVVLTDENDSEVDVRSFSGTAWNFMVRTFPPPRGTAICLTSPNDPACTSCALGGHGSDSECMKGPHTDKHDWGNDLNLRHVHQKQKYGVSVQFPIERYVLGLTSTKVPNRGEEYPGGAAPSATYQGLTNLGCSNPLFAAKLPAPPAGVDPSKWSPTAGSYATWRPAPALRARFYYSHIGGVPHQLLQVDPTNRDSPQKAALSAADWTLILGKDPESYDYTGIDPHMVESYQPRTSVPVPPHGFPVAAPSAAEGTDPISGREWVTDSTMAEHQALVVDREYACIFKLPTPRQCDDAATTADPTLDGLVRLPAPFGRDRDVHARAGAGGLQRRFTDAAGLREGVPDDAGAPPRQAPRTGPGCQRGRHLVHVPDSHGRRATG